VAKKPSTSNLSGNQLLVVGLGVCVIALVAVMFVSSRFFSHEAPPAPPPAPKAARVEQSATASMHFTEKYYQSLLQDDAKQLGIPAPTVSAMAAPLTYANELDQPHLLSPKKGSNVLETDHLRIGVKVTKEWAKTGAGDGIRSDHLVLIITNKSSRPLAYRVNTSLDDQDSVVAVAALPHNAVALAPGETITRAEGLARPKTMLSVDRVQIVELTPLGYYYVSRLLPSQLFLDDRTSKGHEPPKGKPCQFVPWREVRNEGSDKKVGWADVIDFYARHNCDEYTFYREYRRWTQPGALPAHPAQNLTGP
jgi:hypothetical protein